MKVANSSLSSPQQEFWRGARAEIPMVIGATPFGIIFGTLAADADLSLLGALGMSALVFAGSAQFIALGLLNNGASLGILFLTTGIVNLRHLLYSVSLLPHVKSLNQGWKSVLGFWLTDETFVVAIQRYQQPDHSPHKAWYHLGASLSLYVSWQLSTWVGLTVGNGIPALTDWGLEFAVVVTFIGMIMPYLQSWSMGTTVLVAGIVAFLANGIPHQLGLIVAALTGILAGLITDYWGSRLSIKKGTSIDA
ncbi:MAG: AzlC family ABC transporter permease [Cyanobacteriota bacterium]|nr:AzlC family ABC transporter permease [Cyanobacteriota bacterium]